MHFTKLYNFPLTWVEESLDARCIKQVRDWIEAPVSSCISEWLQMPPNKCGMGIISMKNRTQRLALNKRHALKTSAQSDISLLWSDTSAKKIDFDSRLLRHKGLSNAAKELKKDQIDKASSHMLGLGYQGKSVKTIIETVPKNNISLWSSVLETVPANLFNFARKAIQQQLATGANLARWKRISDPMCALCHSNKPQTNKHVLSNCESPVALERYTTRHNKILSILAGWIGSHIRPGQLLHSDLDDTSTLPVRDLFESFRPDLAIADANSITVLELTVCHETNLLASKEFKRNKYKNLAHNTTSLVGSKTIVTLTLEVSTIGFISDSMPFTVACNLLKFSKELKTLIVSSALKSSFEIYCSRNSSV